jgi:hypothetical protein
MPSVLQAPLLGAKSFRRPGGLPDTSSDGPERAHADAPASKP